MLVPMLHMGNRTRILCTLKGIQNVHRALCHFSLAFHALFSVVQSRSKQNSPHHRAVPNIDTLPNSI